MAANMSHIPRFLLPQHAPVWRTGTRATLSLRAANAGLLVRSASRASKPAAKAVVPKAPTAAKTVEVPKAASTKSNSSRAASSKAASNKAASNKAASDKAAADKAASNKASPSKAAAAKASAPKSAPYKAPPTKAPPPATGPQASTPKTPSSSPAVPEAPQPQAATSKTAFSSPVPKAAAPKTSSPSSPAPQPVDPNKPIVLEKPEKFNPPSHGSRLPRGMPKHYGGPMSSMHLKEQLEKDYPGLPPPKDSLTHKILNSQIIHLTISLGTLFSLGVYTYWYRFKTTSDYAYMIPPDEEFWAHPITYIKTCWHAIRLSEKADNRKSRAKRLRNLDDQEKRKDYLRAHGRPTEVGFESWGYKIRKPGEFKYPEDEDYDDPTPPQPEPVVIRGVPPEQLSNPDGSRKKFFGIF